MKNPTRDRLVEAARTLFWKHGYASTGIAQVLKAADAGSGSLYYFFPTKEDLLLAVLEWYQENLWPEVVQPVFDRVSDPIERIFGILDAYRRTGWRKAIEQCLAEAAAKLPDSLDREQLALFVLTTMEGAVMLARAYQSIAPYDAAVTQLRDYFDRLLKDGTDWSVPRPPDPIRSTPKSNSKPKRRSSR